jgi:ABC-type multidrug transport system fused ATPase/permease subunit
MILSTLSKCFRLLTPSMRLRLLVLVPFAIVTGLLEAIGATALVGLIKVASDPSSVAVLPVSRQIYKFLPISWHVGSAAVVSFAILFGAFYIAKNAVLLLIVRMQNMIAMNTLAKFSELIVRQYLEAPYTFFLRRNSADLICNATSATEVAVRNVMLTGINVLSELMVVIGLGATLAVLGPRTAMIFLTALALLLTITLSGSRKMFVTWGRREHKLKKLLLKTLQEIMAGIKEIKLLGREAFFERFVVARQNELAHIESRVAIFGSAMRLLLETVFVVGILVVITLMTLTGTPRPMLFPLVGLYVYAGFRVLPSINRLTMNLNTIRRGAASVDVLYTDLASHGQIQGKMPDDHQVDFSFRRSLAFAGVSFAYEGRPQVFSGIDFTIERGQFVALVGVTGAGKTTLINLMAGLLDPAAGHILLDDVELSSVRRSWQRKIAYVPQSVFLIDDTIRRNIAFALDDDEIDESRVEEVVRRASLAGLIARMPDGLDTRVGDQGVQFSGGERQRIAIARALYQDAEFIVLDEPTSALDYWTERALVESIESLRGSRTVLIATHRDSLIQRVDRVILLRDGRAITYNSYADFLASGYGFGEEQLPSPAPESAREPGSAFHEPR